MSCSVELTANGSLRMTAAVASRHFPSDSLVAMREGRELLLIPLAGPQSGGLLLKQRNARGDRSTLIWEHLPELRPPVGTRRATWDESAGLLRVQLETSDDGGTS